MGYIRWGGKKYYPQRPKPYKPDINELMKPLSEKVGKGNIWGSQIMNVLKEEIIPSPTPTPTITPSPTAAPTSPVLTNLELWWDADDASTMTFSGSDVLTWQSKGNTTATLTAGSTLKPQYTAAAPNPSRSAVLFSQNAATGNRQWMSNLGNAADAVDVSSGMTVYLVLHTTGTSLASSRLVTPIVEFNTRYSSGVNLTEYSYEGQQNTVIRANNVTKIFGNTYAMNTNNDAYQGLKIVETTFESNVTYGDTLELNYNEQGGFFSSQTGVFNPQTTLSAYTFNGQLGATGNPSVSLNRGGQICEVLMYNRSLTPSERTDVMRYLKTKWEFENNFDSTNYFRNELNSNQTWQKNPLSIVLSYYQPTSLSTIYQAYIAQRMDTTQAWYVPYSAFTIPTTILYPTYFYNYGPYGLSGDYWNPNTYGNIPCEPLYTDTLTGGTQYNVFFGDATKCGATPTPTPSVTASQTPTPSVTVTPTISVTPSVTPSLTPGLSSTPTPTQTATPTETPTPSVTPTISVTPSITVSPTPSVTPTISVTPSITVSPSPTETPTPSVTPTISVTPSITVSPTPSITPTISVTPSITVSPTPSITPTISVTPSITPSVTPTITPSPSPVNPGSVPNLMFWFDASDSGNLGLRTSGGIDYVSGFTDSSSNNFDVSQTNTSQQPIFSSDTIGNYVSFDGSDDRLTRTGITGYTSVTAYTNFLVFSDLDGAGGLEQMLVEVTSGRRNIYFTNYGDNYFYKMYDYPGPQYIGLTGVTKSPNYISWAYITNSTAPYDYDGQVNDTNYNTSVADAWGPDTFDRIGLGARTSGGNTAQYKLREVLYYDRKLSATEINNIENYLKDKWGYSSW